MACSPTRSHIRGSAFIKSATNSPDNANGATRTRIRKSTGLDKEQVAAALAAAKMGGTARGIAHERLLAQLAADGYAITDGLPPDAKMLHLLLHDEQELTPESHATCPGRGVYFFDYQPLQPQHYAI